MILKSWLIFLALFLTLKGVQSHSVFTWMKGSKNSYPALHYTKQGEYAEENDVGQRYVTQVLQIGDTNEVLLFGGLTIIGVGFSNSDVWKFNITSLQWKYVSGKYNEIALPSLSCFNSSLEEKCEVGGMWKHKGVSFEGNANDFIFFGGERGWYDNGWNGGYLGTVWHYDLEKDLFTGLHGNGSLSIPSVYGTIGQPSENITPGARFDHMCFGRINENHEQELYILGGTGYSIYEPKIIKNDFWRYNIPKGQFTQISGAQSFTTSIIQGIYSKLDEYASINTPGTIKRSSMFQINPEEALLITGCFEDAGDLDSDAILATSVWKFNFTSEYWKLVYTEENTNQLPVYFEGIYSNNSIMESKHSFHSHYLKDRQEVLIFGGYTTGDSYAEGGWMEDTWYYNMETNQFKFQCCDRPSTSKKPEFGTRTVFKETNVIAARGYPGTVQIKNERGDYEIFLFAGAGIGDSSSGIMGDIWRIHTIPECNELFYYEENVCSGKGECIEIDGFGKCSCQDSFFGENCELFKCFGIMSNETSACTNNGLCFSTDNCACLSNSFALNSDCTTNEFLENLWISITVPIVIILIIMFVIVSLSIFVLVVFKLNTKLKKFEMIEDVDLILAEQEMDNLNLPKLEVKSDFFKVDPKDIKLVKLLGEGGSGTQIFLADWKKQQVAYKLFRIEKIQTEGDTVSDNFEEFEKEVGFVASIKFPFILDFYGATLETKRIGFLMEFCENGDLEAFLQKYQLKNNKFYPLKEKIRILREVSAAMAYIHSLKIMHRDLKLKNVLISNGFTAKLMDFGLSKVLDDEKTRTRQIGTSIFMAPEVISGKYSYAADMFSYSIMFFIVITEDYHPYKDIAQNGNSYSTSGIEIKIRNNPNLRPKFKDSFKVNEKLRELIVKNWNEDPEKRNSFEEMNTILKELNEEISKEEKTVSEDESIEKKIEDLFQKMSDEGRKKMVEKLTKA